MRTETRDRGEGKKNKKIRKSDGRENTKKMVIIREGSNVKIEYKNRKKTQPPHRKTSLNFCTHPMLYGIFFYVGQYVLLPFQHVSIFILSHSFPENVKDLIILFFSLLFLKKISLFLIIFQLSDFIVGISLLKLKVNSSELIPIVFLLLWVVDILYEWL